MVELGRQGQEDSFKFKTSLVYIESSNIARATHKDCISTTNKQIGGHLGLHSTFQASVQACTTEKDTALNKQEN